MDRLRDRPVDAMRRRLSRLLARVEQDQALLELVLAADGRPPETALRHRLAERLRGTAELLASVRAELAGLRSGDR